MADETFIHTLAGREMTFLCADPGRLMLLHRVIESLQKDLQVAVGSNDTDLATSVMREINDLTYTVIESQFTNPADLMHVRKAILGGKLQEADLYALLSNGRKVSATEDDADPPAPKAKAKAAKAAKAPAKKPGRGAR